MTMEWEEDKDGDLILTADGVRGGMVCPHHLPAFVRVVRHGAIVAEVRTIETGKKLLESIALAEAE